jgi:hypothetical protein
MKIRLPGNSPRLTTAAQAARMIEMARLRRADPHTALIVETLGISIADAQDQSIWNRLFILRSIDAAFAVMRKWKAEGSWLYDVNRWHNLDKLWKDELTALSERLWTLAPEEVAGTQAFLKEAA